MPSERFLPIRRGGCSAVPLLDQQTENRAAAKRKKSVEKKDKKTFALFSKKNEVKLNAKRADFSAQKQAKKSALSFT